MTSLEKILEHKIVAIIRGARPEDVIPIGYALLKGGVQLMEVTINSPNAIEVIAALAQEMKDRMLIGAGTVLDATTATAAINAGAAFIISPIVDIGTIKMTRASGAVSIPGAYTATEIHTAYINGGQIIKVFPASGGPGYIKDIRGPLSHIPLMPTGGVDLNNIKAFHEAGAVAFGIATALVDTSVPATTSYLQTITEKAKRYTDAVRGGRA